MLQRTLRFLQKKARNPFAKSIPSSHPNGHFYSPVTDPSSLSARRHHIWPEPPRPCLDIDFNDESHKTILEEWFPRHISDYDYPENEAGKTQFYTKNTQFSWLDARTLFVFLKEIRPGRVIEIGAGFSSLLTADVNHRFLDGQMRFTCIEPFPRDFLKNRVPGLDMMLNERVETMGHHFFESLDAGDILFIDSSHVAKTGSDVNYIFFELLPRLPAGVLVHVHDIFLPLEYPEDWAILENRSWNEQYLLRALLMNSGAYKVLFGCSYAYFKFPELVIKALALPGGKGFSGGSFWLEKTG